MRGYILTEWSVGLSLLTGVWVSVAVTLGGLLPRHPPADERLVIEDTQAWRSSYQLQVARTNPCTDELIVLDLTLTLDIRARAAGESAQVLVYATLTGSPSAAAPDDILPLKEQFGFFAPLYGKPMHVHDLRAALLGRPVPATLVMGVEQTTNGDGLLLVQPGTIKVACA